MTYWNGSGWEADRPADPPRRRGGRRILGATTEAGLITLLMFGLIAGTALAAPGGGKGGGKPSPAGSGTISLALMDGVTEARFGARVTFDVSTASTAYPFVHLRCWQSGTLVAEGRQGFFDTALGNQWFYLGPTPAWQYGAADCTATLEQSTRRGGWEALAATSFHVSE